MKISNKTLAWIYGLAAIAAAFNAYLQFKQGNQDAAIAWLSSAGISCGALSAYLELMRNEDEDNIS
jgi:hypothetical protein